MTPTLKECVGLSNFLTVIGGGYFWMAFVSVTVIREYFRKAMKCDLIRAFQRKHPRGILPIHAIGPTPPVQGVGQALPEVTCVALQWGSE